MIIEQIQQLERQLKQTRTDLREEESTQTSSKEYFRLICRQLVEILASDRPDETISSFRTMARKNRPQSVFFNVCENISNSSKQRWTKIIPSSIDWKRSVERRTNICRSNALASRSIRSPSFSDEQCLEQKDSIVERVEKSNDDEVRSLHLYST
jgi:hypothetical protein